MFSAKSTFLYLGLLFTGSHAAHSQSQVNFKPENSLYNSLNFNAPSGGGDSIQFNKKRIRLVTAANIVGYGGTLIALNYIWYANYPRSGFHFFNDDAEWQQMDKVGHVYSAYIESNASMEMWRWAGLSRKKRIWIGGLSGVAYQSIIEILDGFSSEYGFSPGDFTANIIGSATFISQELAWDEQKIKLKFSFHRKNYGDDQLDMRANKIYGKSEAERFIKDYNGQTYWASANLKSFFKESKFPPWLNLAVGYGAEGMFGARNNIATDANGNITFDRSDIRRYRQWYIAPDIDLTKIHSNSKVAKVLLFVANSFKFPTPSLEFCEGSFKAHWLTF
ncbi:MAG: DUF2279 domain-containing protein [Ginsengibacter sp.]